MSNTRIGIVLGAALALSAGVGLYQASRPSADAAGECAPDGGIRCDGDSLLLCQAGAMRTVGTCAGGCSEADNVARCVDERGSLRAPVGALCQPGMGLCGLTAQTLLVCREGRLALGAECPGGCFDAGESAGLYCNDEQESLRFAAGFGCPRFERQSPYTCGADSRGLLVCVDGLLSAHTVRCDRCVQTRAGQVTCFDAAGDLLDPATGQVLPRTVQE